jgi:hypothetical protein
VPPPIKGVAAGLTLSVVIWSALAAVAFTVLV